MIPNIVIARQKTGLWQRQGGFTLFEVLIALFVVTIGLFGIAGLNALAMNNSSAARSRDLAAIMANSLGAAMTANQAYWAAGLFAAPASITVNGTTVTGDSTLAATPPNCADGSTTCTAAQIAAYDVQQWGTTIQNLPGGTGTVTCTTAAGNPVSCTITVSWNENAVGTKLIQATGAATFSYQTVVQP